MLGTQGIGSPAGFLLPTSEPIALPDRPGATVKPVSAARAAEAAKEMEATFLALLLKQMRESLDSEDGGGLFPGDTGDVQGGLFDMFMSRHLAEAGGVGMATAIASQLQGPTTKTNTDAPALAPRGYAAGSARR
jgi:peptidoglycan hydrolase FlgJ